MKKRILIFFIVTTLLCGLLPVSTLAATTVSSGTCGSNGSNLTWILDDEGTLTISGTGAMQNYSSASLSPWYSRRYNIKKLVIENVVTTIGSYALYGCTSLTNITIPGSVTAIGSYALYGCTSLTNLTIPEGVTTISSEVFFGCTSLTNVTIPKSVTTIDDRAFYDCSALTEITIPENVTSIGYLAFSGCTRLTALNYNAKVIESIKSNIFMSAGKNAGGIVLTVGPNVQMIPANLFYTTTASSYPNLANLIIANGVTTIGAYAFYSCINLTDVTIPESVTSIGDHAFYGCTGLTEITIPESVTSIGDSAFYCCTGLTEITIPKNVTSMGYNAFYGCTGLTEINYNANDDVTNALFYNAGKSKNGITLKIGSNVQRIPDYLFSNTNITSVTIPDSVTAIGDCAFLDCNNLAELTISKNLMSIGNSAFNGCTSLAEVTIPENVTSIESNAFEGCTSLAEVTIPKNVTSIGNGAFSGCTSLAEVTIPKNVKTIGYLAFSDCTDLTAINYNANAVEDFTMNSQSFKNAGKSADGIVLTVGANVEKIPAYLFYTSDASYCPNLTNLIIANGVTKIGTSAFYNCTNLTKITIPESVTAIGNSAFCECTGLTEINYNANVVSENSYLFYNAGKSKNGITLIIGANVQRIPDYLFSNTNLTNVTIPESVTSVGNYAFASTPWLNSLGDFAIINGILISYQGLGDIVTIPKSVTSIASDAFHECTGLQSITIPESVTSISDHAFYNCTGLTEINYNANVVSDMAKDTEVFYNAGDKASGITLTIGANVKKIPANLFSNASFDGPKLHKVIISNGVTAIGDNVFSHSSILTEVTIPESVTQIGNYAFSDCPLTQINYNAKAADDLKEDSCVFYNSGSGLNGTTVTVGANVKKIPANLFCINNLNNYYSPKISKVIFKGNAPIIGNKAFDGISLTAYYLYGNSTWTSDIMKNDCGNGNLTWTAYSDSPVTGCESIVPNKTSYVQEESLDCSGLGIVLIHSDGFRETIDYGSGKLILGEYDMSVPGLQNISITYGENTCSFSIYVYQLMTKILPSENYPESSHNYENNLDKTYTYTASGARTLIVTFSSKTATESNVDYIYVNGTGYTGTALAGQTITITGDTLTIRLTSDSNETYYGFSIDSIVEEYVQSIMHGDANGDGKIGINDALTIFKIISGKTAAPVIGTPEFTAADCSVDGKIGITDALAIFKHISGKEPLL